MVIIATCVSTIMAIVFFLLLLNKPNNDIFLRIFITTTIISVFLGIFNLFLFPLNQSKAEEYEEKEKEVELIPIKIGKEEGYIYTDNAGYYTFYYKSDSGACQQQTVDKNNAKIYQCDICTSPSVTVYEVYYKPMLNLTKEQEEFLFLTTIDKHLYDRYEIHVPKDTIIIT